MKSKGLKRRIAWERILLVVVSLFMISGIIFLIRNNLDIERIENSCNEVAKDPTESDSEISCTTEESNFGTNTSDITTEELVEPRETEPVEYVELKGFLPDFFSTNSIFLNWVRSWECSEMLIAYKTRDFSNVQEFVTSDGRYYIGSLDGFGYGVKFIRDNTYCNISYFEKYGITSKMLENENYKPGNTVVNTDIVDLVMQDIFKDIRKNMIQKAESYGIELSPYQIDALSYIYYMYGPNANVDCLMNYYAEYGNSECLAELYVTTTGVKPFVDETGVKSPSGISKSDALWSMFHSNRLLMGDI